MTFSISEFQSELAQHGYLKPEHFNVYIATPPFMVGKTIFGSQAGVGIPSGNLPQIMTMRSTEARTPDPMILTAFINRYGIGPAQEQPYNARFNQTSFMFICDKYGAIWNFWHQWMNGIFNFSPVYNGQAGNQNNGPASYLAMYKEAYASTIAVDEYDPTGKLAEEYTYNYAFPIKLIPIALDWNSDGELVELNVIITYRDYSVTGGSLGSTNGSPSQYSPTAAMSVPTQTPLLS
jgi:hypothetical protein